MSEELGMDLQKENISVVGNKIKAAARGIYYIVMGKPQHQVVALKRDSMLCCTTQKS